MRSVNGKATEDREKFGKIVQVARLQLTTHNVLISPQQCTILDEVEVALTRGVETLVVQIVVGASGMTLTEYRALCRQACVEQGSLAKRTLVRAKSTPNMKERGRKRKKGSKRVAFVEEEAEEEIVRGPTPPTPFNTPM